VPVLRAPSGTPVRGVQTWDVPADGQQGAIGFLAVEP
jgi:hypothetical protein